MANLQVNYLMDKLFKIDKNLGGTAYTSKNTGDEFANMKDAAVTKLHQIRKKMEDKDKKGRNVDTIKTELEVKDLLNEVDQLLTKMNEALRKQSKDSKKYSQQNIQSKERMYNNLRTQVSELQNLIQPGGQTSTFEDVETVSEMKSKLMGQKKGVQRKYQQKEASKEEKEAIDRWKQNDEKMDAQLDLIVAGTEQWKQNAIIMGEKIDHTMEQINKLDKEVDITNAELEQQNKALKDIVTKYRQPNKFCLDIVLICVILGIAGAIYETIK